VSSEEERGSLTEGALVGDRFRVQRIIGRGGMGEVYAARHTQTGKDVALKLIRTTPGSGDEQVRRFLREARAATAIQHPNVIEVFDVFAEPDGTPVMVMELLKGEPLSKRLARERAFPLHVVAELLVPACRALQAAHAKGIVHRDLKPDNIFLATTPSGTVPKVLDFGIAKVLDPTKISSETQGQQTNTGSILGTPHYMSYEQAMSDKTVDHRTDVWSMGVMIFEALTGRRPLSYETLGEMYTKLLQSKVPSIHEYLPDLPADVAAVVDHALAKLAQDRLADIGQVADVLSRYADPSVAGAQVGGRYVPDAVAPRPGQTGSGLTASAAPVSGSTAELAPRTGPRRAILVSAAALVVAASAGVFAWNRRAPGAAAPPPVAGSLSDAPSAVASFGPRAPESPLPSSLPSAAPSTSGAASAQPAPPSSSVRPPQNAMQNVAVAAHPSGTRPQPAPSVHPEGAAAAAPPSTPASSSHKGIPSALPY
jgi:serine/threonine-protein kinase